MHITSRKAIRVILQVIQRWFQLRCWPEKWNFPPGVSASLLTSWVPPIFQNLQNRVVWKHKGHMKLWLHEEVNVLWNTFTFNISMLCELFCSSVKMINSPIYHTVQCGTSKYWRTYEIYLAIIHKTLVFLITFLKEKNLFFNKSWHIFPLDFICHLR